MKVAFLGETFYGKGGAELVMINEASYLFNKGYEVCVFTVANPDNYKVPYSVYSTTEDYYALKKKSGEPLTTADKIYNLTSRFYNPLAVKAFNDFLNKEKPDILHFHSYSRYLPPIIRFIAKKRGIKIVSTEHTSYLACPAHNLMISGTKYCDKKLCIQNNYLHCLKNKCVQYSTQKSLCNSLELWGSKWAYLKYTDMFLTPSNSNLNLLKQTGVKPKKLHVLQNFVDLDKFKYSDNTGNYYIFVGRVAEEKGVRTLVKAFETLKHLNLKIVGTGDIEQELKEYCSQHSLNNIEFSGVKENEELVIMIQNSKALILPSKCNETFGLVIVEAFACGKPVVASNIAAIPELVNESTGKLFNSSDVKDLVAVLDNFDKKSNDEIKQIGSFVRQKVENQYSLDKHCTDLVGFYNLLLNKN